MEKFNLTEKEVAATRGLGVRMLRLMRMRGTGPAWVKVSGVVGRRGGRVLYPRAGLDAWIAARPGGGEREPAR